MSMETIFSYSEPVTRVEAALAILKQINVSDCDNESD
jgi:hypothetical protein